MTLSSTADTISIAQAGATLQVSAPTLIGSLAITAASDIVVSTAITIGGSSTGAISLTSQSGNIQLNNSLTANGINGITLAVSGTGTIGGSGRVNTSGEVTETFGSQSVTVNSTDVPTVTAGGATTVIGQFASLTVNSQSNITIAGILNFPNQSFSFNSIGSNTGITLNNDITATDLTLNIDGSGTIGGTGNIACTNILTINVGSNTATLLSNGIYVAVADGGATITTTAAPFLFSLTAPTVVINSGTTINAPSHFYIHTNRTLQTAAS